MKDVMQKNVTAGKEETFQMKLERSQFLVKNFTDGNIKVKLGDNEAYSVIAPNCWERVFNNIDNVNRLTIPMVTNIVIVIPDSNGLVEVASID